MLTKNNKRSAKSPEVIYRNDKPVSVIIDLEEYIILMFRFPCTLNRISNYY